MICATCQENSSRIKVVDGQERCHNCGGFSEAGGVHPNLSRNRFSVRHSQMRHEGDMIVPHKYDRNARKLVPNPEFVKLYPDKVNQYFDNKELKQAGLPKLGKKEKVNAQSP